MIYFIQDQAKLYIKIGFTSKDDPEERKKMLQTGNGAPLMLLAAIEGGREEEQELHKRFAGARECGEWFRPVPELVRHIVAGQAERAYASGISIAKRPTKKADPWPMTIYLAGKIKRNCWRHSIVEGLADSVRASCTTPANKVIETGGGCEHTTGYQVHWRESGSQIILKKSIAREHHYSGPFFIGCKADHECTDCGMFAKHGITSDDCNCCTCVFGTNTHGCPGSTERCACYHGQDSHGAGAQGSRLFHEYEEKVAGEVVSACYGGILHADLVFAWINSPDCYGTITEIGYAKALGKRIWVAGPERYRDMWFVYESADKVRIEDSEPKALLFEFLGEHESTLAGKAVAQ